MFEEGTKLRHYKGGRYTVIGVATHSEEQEEVVVYQNDVDNRIWVRPIHMFYEEVEYKGEIVPRFEVIEGDCVDVVVKIMDKFLNSCISCRHFDSGELWCNKKNITTFVNSTKCDDWEH